MSKPDKPLTTSWTACEGSPTPLGASWIAAEQAYNFAIYSKHATNVTLLLFDKNCSSPVFEFEFDYLKNKSGRIWHCRIPHRLAGDARYYAYSIDGPKNSNSNANHDGQRNFEFHAFNPLKLLLDPYAQQVYFPETFSREAAFGPESNMGQAPLAMLPEGDVVFNWGDDRVRFHEHDLVTYEMHVAGFTRNPNSGVEASRRGTYLGVIDKIPHLVDLGVTAVELLPVHQFDPQEGNFWGYMTLNFFAPHAQYASNPLHAADEFREMVRALHAAGIEVLIDVVFNHTAEGGETGPCYSFKGIDNSTYYLLNGSEHNRYANYSGTGNTLHCQNRYVCRMVLDSLRTWVESHHVDGFRFDLAAILNRGANGSVNHDDSLLVSAIRADPVLGRVRLIAEPWDAAGLDQLGRAFPGKRWWQWNGRFRDDIRRFVKGDQGLVPAVMRRLYGSDDLFPDSLMEACHPYQSVNYVNSHDGFTLYDQVAYNERHNWANGEANQDGHRDNNSWNCGWEGDRGVPDEVMELRIRQAKNFCCLLMLSNGTPMLRAGDEFLNTQTGNNNPYNQDNETSWIDWSRLEMQRDFYRFFRNMIAFRKLHPTLSRSRFYREDIQWFGAGPDIDMSVHSQHFAYYLSGASQADVDLYVMLNASDQPIDFAIQQFSDQPWDLIVDTSLPSPHDIIDIATPARSQTHQQHQPPTAGNRQVSATIARRFGQSNATYAVQPRSVVVFTA